MSSYAAQITAAGISAPAFADILSGLQNDFRGIFGSDVYIEPDSQDGQMLGLLAKMINDTNNSNIATFNAFSPTFAQGAGLSSVVKINGIARLSPSFSSAPGDVVGTVGTIITNGVVADVNGNLWNLPDTVTIPPAGTISVTVIAQQPGAIVAAAGDINVIRTPTKNWQTFVSSADAAQGNPVEDDAELRARQSESTGLPAQTPLAALQGALANLPSAGRVRVYENPTGAPDSNGLPAHSISAVVSGGVVADIVTTIGQKKTPGAATFGDNSGFYTDPITGIGYTINYNALANQAIKVQVTLTAGAGYSTNIGTEIQNSVAAFINALAIGGGVQYSRLNTPAYLNGAADGSTYEITGIEVAKVGDAFGVIDIPILYKQGAACNPADVAIVT